MRAHTRLMATAALLLLAACQGDAPPKTASVGAAMPNIPLPPDAQLVGRAGSQDALQLVFQSPDAVAIIADYYRGVFTRDPWRLVSDTRDSAGVVTLYAEQQAHPMWVRILAAGSVTRVELTGAVPEADTTFAAKRRLARDSSNTLVPLRRSPP